MILENNDVSNIEEQIGQLSKDFVLKGLWSVVVGRVCGTPKFYSVSPG